MKPKLRDRADILESRLTRETQGLFWVKGARAQVLKRQDGGGTSNEGRLKVYAMCCLIARTGKGGGPL